MPQFLLSGRNSHGVKVTECVVAASADAALADFKSRGYDEVVLHTDDFAALFTNQQALSDRVTPEEYLAYRDRGTHCFMAWSFVRNLYLQSWFYCVIGLAVLVGRRIVGLPWGLLDGASALVVFLPLVSGLVRSWFRPSLRYDRLIEAAGWARWEEVLRRLPGVQSMVSPFEYAFREAQAWAGLGDLNKAFAIVEPLRNDPSIPQWLYYGRLGELYAAAGKWDQMIPAAEYALQLAPENSTLLLDLASNVIEHSRDASRAKALLAQAKTHAISDLLTPFVDQIEGLIALEEGRTEGARDYLDRAINALNARLPAQPVYAPYIASLHGYLAIASARLGNATAARGHFAKAEARLRARKVQPLLDRIEQELGNTHRVDLADQPAEGACKAG